ncbi:MAG: FAD-dependent oxidoreductase [Actinomycetota bacterium]
MAVVGVLGYPGWLWPLIGFAALAHFVGLVLFNTLRPKYRRLFGARAPLSAIWNSLLPSIGVQIYLWLALLVMWTPIWWAARGIVELTDIGTATAWFAGAFGAFYLIWLLRGFAGRSVNRRWDDQIAADDIPVSDGKRVAVIGAGMAGMVAAKELREEGHTVVVFERTDGPGGVWAASKSRGGVAWDSTMTSTGALNTALSGSIAPIHHPEHEMFPHHLNRGEFLDVLVKYEADHDIFDHSLHCNTEVEAMTRLPGDRWSLRVRDRVENAVRDEEFDAVTICTGLNKESFTPTIAGQDQFKGPQIHVEEYRPTDAKYFVDKRVLVVGMGETSSDVVKDLADNGAEHVYVSQRGPTWVIPRDVGSLPPDHIENRLIHDGPMFHRFAMLVSGVAPFGLWPILRPTRVKVHKFRNVFRILVMHHPNKLRLYRFGSLNWTKSDNLYFALENGQATVVRDVMRLDEHRAYFADGREEDIDAIIYCSGYRPGESLLPPDEEGAHAPDAPKSARDLYKLTMLPDHPNVAAIGFARGQIGAITLSTDMQARWWALVLSGKRALPDDDTMRREMTSMRHHIRRFHQPTRTTLSFAYSVARNEIGCAPDLFELFRTNRRMWFAFQMGPICAAHFRLRGPHATPGLVREQIMQPNAVQSEEYVDSIDILSGCLPLALFVVPAYGAWSRIVPGFNARNATRSYV